MDREKNRMSVAMNTTARTISLVGCPECDAKVGELCRSDKGRIWKSSTHYARRRAAHGPRLRERRSRTEKKQRRVELLEALWAALKLADRESLAACMKELRADDAEEHQAEAVRGALTDRSGRLRPVQEAR
jgi:hypothetical protein